MSVTLKSNILNYKNGDEYVGLDVISDKTTEERVAEINSAGAAQVSAVQAKGAETLDSIPDDYTSLQGEVDDLKSAIASVIVNNIFTTNGLTTGRVLNEDGSDKAVSTGAYTHIIPVDGGETYKLSFSHDNTSWGVRIFGYINGSFDAQILFVTTTSSGAFETDIEIPSTVNGIKISLYKYTTVSNVVLVKYVDGSAVVTAIDTVARSGVSSLSTTVTTLQSDVQGMGETVDDMQDAVDDMQETVNGIITIIPASANLLNPATITEGKFWKTTVVDGRAIMEQADNSAYSCAYIDVVSGQSYVVTGISYNAYNADAEGYATGIAYTASGSVATPVLDTSAINAQYGNSDKTTTRVYFSWRHATYATDTFMANAGTSIFPYVPYSEPKDKLNDDISVSFSQLIDVPSIDASEVYTVDINGSGDYTSFTGCLQALANNTNKKIIYVKAGTYDVFDEIGGAAYAASISGQGLEWSEVSVIVPRNTSIIGIGEVVLEFKPTAAEMPSDVASLLSPVNVIYDIYMENITIDCDNCRYGIHDETGANDGTIGTRHIYKNMKINHTYTDRGMKPAFGCGMQKSQYMEFDNCVFVSADRPLSFHNRGTASGDYTDGTIIVVDGCALISGTDKSLRFGNVNGKQVKIDARVFNTYLSGGVWIGNESSTERPNAYALTLVRSGNPTITIKSETNIYTPVVYQ